MEFARVFELSDCLDLASREHMQYRWQSAQGLDYTNTVSSAVEIKWKKLDIASIK